MFQVSVSFWMTVATCATLPKYRSSSWIDPLRFDCLFDFELTWIGVYVLISSERADWVEN
jgi:hypothetical protein